MKSSLFAVVTFVVCHMGAIAQAPVDQSESRHLTYRQVLERWDRSRAYGDPRDLKTFSQDMVTRLQSGDETDDFSEGLRDGIWIRFYARSEQIFGDAAGLVLLGVVILILFALYRLVILPLQRMRRVSLDFAQARPDENKTTLVMPKAKRKILPIVLSAVSFVIMMSVFKECQREQLARQQAQRASTMVTVWMPTGPDGRLIPYWDVEILDKGNDYVRFRTQDGQIMEQHGSFRIETSKRSE